MDCFDLHCDTAAVLFNINEPLACNGCHISLEKTAAYGRYGQLAAIWSDSRFGNAECWDRFIAISDDFAERAKKAGAAVCSDALQIDEAFDAGKRAFIPAVEDARILCGDIKRLDVMRERGVRFLTLVWSGETELGGAHNTEAGLTSFGERVVDRCFGIGIVPDLSHASDAMAAQVIELALRRGRLVVATHSNARALCGHRRNLTDDLFRGIIETGGIVGLNLYAAFLCDTGEADAAAAAEHIMHWRSVGGTGHISVGADFDGIDKTPADIRDASELPALEGALLRAGLDRKETDAVLFDNAYAFMRANL